MDPTVRFIEAQRRMLDRYRVRADSRFLHLPTAGTVHVLEAGTGTPVVMINGIGTPGAMWAPLMAQLTGLRILVVELPAYGLTEPNRRFFDDVRRNAVRFLDEVLAALALEAPPVVANSLASLYASWFVLEQPARVSALVHVGCPAVVLDTSAPLPMRLLSVRPLGRLLTRLQPPSSRQVEQLSRMVNQHPLVPELVELLVATERLPGFRPTFLANLHALLRVRGNRPTVRLRSEQLARIGQPALLVWGQDDPFGSPAVGRQVTAAMPHAFLETVRGGHTPWLTEPERIGRLITGFLNQYG